MFPFFSFVLQSIAYEAKEQLSRPIAWTKCMRIDGAFYLMQLAWTWFVYLMNKMSQCICILLTSETVAAADGRFPENRTAELTRAICILSTTESLLKTFFKTHTYVAHRCPAYYCTSVLLYWRGTQTHTYPAPRESNITATKESNINPATIKPTSA